MNFLVSVRAVRMGMKADRLIEGQNVFLNVILHTLLTDWEY